MNSERITKSKKNSNLIFSIKKVKNQKKWTREEDELLIQLAEKFNEKHWKEISKMFVKKNSLQCFSRYKRIRPGIIKGSWKKDEDLQIIDLVNKYGKSWSKISKLLGTRNGKQIRDRFINVLDPEIRKGKFTDEEDQRLVDLYRNLGPKWATIAKYYPNRTADMIKNRFHSSIKKRLTGESDSMYKDCNNYEHTVISKLDTVEDSLRSINKTDSNLSMLNLPLHEQFYANKFDSYNNDSPVVDPSGNNFSSTVLSREAEDDLYPYGSRYNIDNIFNCDRDVKIDGAPYGQGNLAWSFEDFFTV